LRRDSHGHRPIDRRYVEKDRRPGTFPSVKETLI